MEHKMKPEILQISPTMDKVIQLAVGLPIDINNKVELKEALATSALSIIDALDNDRIDFEHGNDKAMLFGLLVVAMDIVLDGKLRTSVKLATIN